MCFAYVPGTKEPYLWKTFALTFSPLLKSILLSWRQLLCRYEQLVLQAVCVCVYQHQAHTQGSVLQEVTCSQSKSFLLGPTFSLVARGSAAELLLSGRTKASCFRSLFYSLVVGESPLLVEQCSVLSQPVSGWLTPVMWKEALPSHFLGSHASLCCILCTSPVPGVLLCKQLSSLKIKTKPHK